MKAKDQAPPDHAESVKALCDFMRWCRCVPVGHLRLAAQAPSTGWSPQEAPRFAWRQTAAVQALVHLQGLYGGDALDEQSPADRAWADWEKWTVRWLGGLRDAEGDLYEKIGQHLATSDLGLRTYAYVCNQRDKNREFRLLLAHVELRRRELDRKQKKRRLATRDKELQSLKSRELELLHRLLGREQAKDKRSAAFADQRFQGPERFDRAQEALITHLQACPLLDKPPAVRDLVARGRTAKSRNDLLQALDRALAAMEQVPGRWRDQARAMRRLGPRERQLLFIDALQALCPSPEMAGKIAPLIKAAQTVAKAIPAHKARALPVPTPHDIAAHRAWRKRPLDGLHIRRDDHPDYFLRVFVDALGLTVDRRDKGDKDKEAEVYTPIRRLLLALDGSRWSNAAKALAGAMRGDKVATRRLAALGALPSSHPLSLHGTWAPLHVIPASDLVQTVDEADALESVRQLALAAADATADPLYRVDGLVPTSLKPRPSRLVRQKSNWFELALDLQAHIAKLRGTGRLLQVLRSGPEDESAQELAQRLSAWFTGLLEPVLARAEETKNEGTNPDQRTGLLYREKALLEEQLFDEEVKSLLKANGLALRASHLNDLNKHLYEDLTSGSAHQHRRQSALAEVNARRMARRLMARASRCQQHPPSSFHAGAGSQQAGGLQAVLDLVKRVANDRPPPVHAELQAELAKQLRPANGDGPALVDAMREHPLLASLFVPGRERIESRGSPDVER